MGGCVSANIDVNDRRPNVFHVWNVDEQGNIFTPGQIEVTDTELVLHQKGKEPILWPMRCLRRYGFDAELFSFESGRRCATGTGIYAFKCERAEALFNLLQEQIQNSGQENQADGATVNTIGIGINSHSGVGNGVLVASAAAANGSILRPASSSIAADIGGPAGNYLEPIVTYRTRSILNNNNNNNSTGFRDGFSRMTTQSLPSNLTVSTENGSTGVTDPLLMLTSTTPHYVNEDVTLSSIKTGNCCSGQIVNVIRPPLTPPAVLPSLHEYTYTTIMQMTDDSVSRPKSLQECQQSSYSSTDKRTSEVEASVSSCDAGATASSDSPQPMKVPFSILDLPKNMFVTSAAAGAIKFGSNGCRQVVLRGHSLDETTNYARLDDLMKQEHTSAQRHLYMNVVPDNVQSKYTKDGVVIPPSNQHHHHHNPYYHNHHAAARLYGRQQSVDSPGRSNVNSGVKSKALSATTAATTSTKDSVNNNNDNSQHHRHHSNSISYHLTTTAVSRQVNYAVLDLNHRGSNSSGGSVSMGASGDVVTTPTSPVTLVTPPSFEPLAALNSGACCQTSPLEGYATIDFDRTIALSNVSSAHPFLDDDESVRKTRHNSTISDLLLSKHNSIVSE